MLLEVFMEWFSIGCIIVSAIFAIVDYIISKNKKRIHRYLVNKKRKILNDALKEGTITYDEYRARW